MLESDTHHTAGRVIDCWARMLGILSRRSRSSRWCREMWDARVAATTMIELNENSLFTSLTPGRY